METGNKLLRAALRYAELGYEVFPCKEGGSIPLTAHGFQDASTDPKQIKHWWHYHPAANIGLATAGLLVVDIDAASEGEVNPWLQDEPDRLADLASTSTSCTPRGGLHYVFRRPPDKGWRCTQGELAPHVDTRTDGGYIVVPPSVRVQGPYRWVDGLELDCPVAELQEPPAWLADMLDRVASTRATGAPAATTAHAPSEPGNTIPAGQRNATLARLAGTMRRVGMTQAEIVAAILVANHDRCVPPLDVIEVQRIAISVAKYEPDQVSVAMAEGHWEQLWSNAPKELQPLSLGELLQSCPALRPPVIHGLLRQGETMNVISAPKLMKSWLVTDLALSMTTGRPWLGVYQTVPGSVLIIDNELHRETTAHRIPKVGAARDVDMQAIAERLFVLNLRGRLHDIFSMGAFFRSLQPKRFQVIVLDAFYRFMPRDSDENDNGTMANVYNQLDSYADLLGCSFVLIHHTSKGNQSGKSLTDVGAGAGSQSRAADTHVVLRQHEDDDVVVFDAAVRSWSPVFARCLRWTFPVWQPADELDPADLRSERPRRRDTSKSDDGEERKQWTVEEFVDQFVIGEPRSRSSILELAEQGGLSMRRAIELLQRAEEKRLVFRWSNGRNRACQFGTVPPPSKEDDE